MIDLIVSKGGLGGWGGSGLLFCDILDFWVLTEISASEETE